MVPSRSYQDFSVLEKILAPFSKVENSSCPLPLYKPKKTLVKKVHVSHFELKTKYQPLIKFIADFFLSPKIFIEIVEKMLVIMQELKISASASGA